MATWTDPAFKQNLTAAAEQHKVGKIASRIMRWGAAGKDAFKRVVVDKVVVVRDILQFWG